MESVENTFITTEDCQELAQGMAYKYGAYLEGRRFEITAQQEHDVVSVKVLLRNEDDSFYYPVEGRLAFAEEGLKAFEAATFLIDYIDLYFAEFWQEAEALYLPIDWANHEYDAVNFQIKGQIFNLMVEKMADEILAKNEVYDNPRKH